jgi:hypothetical protein
MSSTTRTICTSSVNGSRLDAKNEKIPKAKLSNQEAHIEFFRVVVRNEVFKSGLGFLEKLPGHQGDITHDIFALQTSRL